MMVSKITIHSFAVVLILSLSLLSCGPNESDSISKGVGTGELESIWPHGKIPYLFHRSCSASIRTQIVRAMNEWQKRTRSPQIKFIKKRSEKHILTVRCDHKSSAGRSDVGFRRGSTMRINPNLSNIYGTALHELGHVIGLVHEHSRSDRDKYVKVHEGNLRRNCKGNFVKVGTKYTTDLRDYDSYNFDSIMHYHGRACAKDQSKPTMTYRKSGKPVTVQRSYLSAGDLEAVRLMYNTLKFRRKDKLEIAQKVADRINASSRDCHYKLLPETLEAKNGDYQKKFKIAYQVVKGGKIFQLKRKLRFFFGFYDSSVDGLVASLASGEVLGMPETCKSKGEVRKLESRMINKLNSETCKVKAGFSTLLGDDRANLVLNFNGRRESFLKVFLQAPDSLNLALIRNHLKLLRGLPQGCFTHVPESEFSKTGFESDDKPGKWIHYKLEGKGPFSVYINNYSPNGVAVMVEGENYRSVFRGLGESMFFANIPGPVLIGSYKKKNESVNFKFLAFSKEKPVVPKKYDMSTHVPQDSWDVVLDRAEGVSKKFAAASKKIKGLECSQTSRFTFLCTGPNSVRSALSATKGVLLVDKLDPTQDVIPRRVRFEVRLDGLDDKKVFLTGRRLHFEVILFSLRRKDSVSEKEIKCREKGKSGIYECSGDRGWMAFFRSKEGLVKDVKYLGPLKTKN